MVSFFRHNYIYQISSFSSKNCSYTIDDTVSKDLKIVDSSRILASLIIFCIQLSLLASVFSNLILKSRCTLPLTKLLACIMTGQNSGCKKRQKKRTRDLFIQSQRGSLDKFVIKKNAAENLKSDCVDNIPESNDHFDDTIGHLSEHDNVVNASNVDSQNFCEQPSSCVNIYDPRYWENLDNKMRDVLIEKGPKREMNLVFPLDKYSRHFSYTYYMRKMSNGETSDRNWLVYSKHVDKVYCFCCKLFKSKSCSNMFANDGFNDWKHLSERLKDHERSIEHMTNMETWNELKVRFEKNLTIDKELQKEIATEKERWRQNEFISLLAHNVQHSIIAIIKEAKYFSVILDCTPDVSHQEQMTLIIRCVNMSDKKVKVEEYFLEFLKVDDTSGQGLFEKLLDVLKSLTLDVDNVRGQSYDNGSNMKGKHQGVQRRLLDINSKALYMPCACHSLNLVVSDMAHSCLKAISFFGVVQRIYTMFSGSTKRWNILLDHVPFFTVKSLSNTRWESRINSVKAIRFQTLQVRSALIELYESCDDAMIKSDAESLIMAFDNFEFLLGMVIWYEILFAINSVSKNLQSKSMCIDNALKQLQECEFLVFLNLLCIFESETCIKLPKKKNTKTHKIQARTK
ncbi:BnaC02g20490D [Brassica napus]|uniref:BnaC02g20490D protein n=2 Tax=Brassica TaxID=3705 RepID=A0A078F8U3_BRANA|nr:BnaC02g20490D [Brassica napus]VDD22722.1 unnamed protein product [Brassica oleracea]